MMTTDAERLLDDLLDAIRKHRDQRGDDRCWRDDEELYAALPECYTPPKRDSRVELALCEKYIACRHNPATEYVSPQRRIEELEAAEVRYRAALAWAVGFIRCAHSQTCNDYADFHEASALAAGGLFYGPFQEMQGRAELAEEMLRRLTGLADEAKELLGAKPL